MGGNLSLIIATMGTKYEIDAKIKFCLLRKLENLNINWIEC